jgi:hypothetical protein
MSRATQEADQALSRQIMDRRSRREGTASYDAFQAEAKAKQIKAAKRDQEKGR